MIFTISAYDFNRQRSRERKLTKAQRFLDNFSTFPYEISWKEVLRKDPCVFCNDNRENRPRTIDHIIAKSRGGTDNINNLAPACNRCNYRKGRKQLLRFLMKLRREKMDTYRATVYYSDLEGNPKGMQVREVAAENKEDFKDTIIQETEPGTNIDFGPISRKEKGA